MTEPGGTASPVFDPRHDARFQRGYQAGEGGDGGAAARQPRQSDPRPAAAPSPPPAAAAPGYEPAAVESDDPADDPTAAAADHDSFQDELEPLRWNPFIAVLWLTGVVFVVGAVVLQYQAATFSYSISYDGTGPMPFEMLLQQMSYSLSSPVLTAGLIILAGLLFWHAWAWRARRRPAGS